MQISPDETWLAFDQEASVLHNKVNFTILSELCNCDIKQFQVRAFSGWPGTKAKVLVVDKNGQKKTLDIKTKTTTVCNHESVQFNEADNISFVDGSLVFPCGRGTALEVCLVFKSIFEFSMISAELNHVYTCTTQAILIEVTGFSCILVM